MSIYAYSGFGIGVEKTQLTSGDGFTRPRISSVVSVHPGRVRVTFDRDMGLGEDSGLLVNENYIITRLSDSDRLRVLYVIQQDSVTFDLLTEQQKGVSYQLQVQYLYDAWGNLIDPAFSTWSFNGTAPIYVTPATLISMVGVDAGLQKFTEYDFLPDMSIPILDAEDPAPSSIDINEDHYVLFDIHDPDKGINLAATKVWIEGVLAFDGSAGAFYAPYNGPATALTVISGGYHFVFDKVTAFTSYKWITVRCYTEDLAYLPNNLDRTWSFRVRDYLAPTIVNNLPTGPGQLETVNVTFSLRDIDGCGVDLTTLYVSIEGEVAVAGGVIQSGFAGPLSAITVNAYSGYDVVLDKATLYASSKTIYVVGSVQDNSDNLLNFNWSFTIRDYLGPYVHPVEPLEGQIDVPIDSNITVEVTDDDYIISGTLKVEIDLGEGFVVAYQQGDVPPFKPGFQGPGSAIVAIAKGYRILIDPEIDFVYGGSYVVRVTAHDPAGNPERKDGPPP